MADLRLGIDASRAKRGGDQFNNQLDKIQRNTKQTQRQLKRTGASVDKFGQSISRVGKLFVAAAVAFAGREIIQLSDSFTRLTNSIRIATDTQEELQAVTGAVFDIAFRTRAPVESLGILYGRAALAADALGATQQELLQFTEGVGKALAIQGTSAGEARGALLQLSQAIGGSIVRAEEFNSLIEGARPILIAVAANLDDTGVSLTELRQRVVEGKLTSAEFFRAFLKGTKDLDELFQKTAPTIGQGFEAIRTGATLAVGQFNLLTGASTSFAETLQEVGKQIGTNLLPFLAGFAAQFQILAQTIRTGIIELLRMTGLLPGLSGEFTQTADDVGLIIDGLRNLPTTLIAVIQATVVSTLAFFEKAALRIKIFVNTVKGTLAEISPFIDDFLNIIKFALPGGAGFLIGEIKFADTETLIRQRTALENQLAGVDQRANDQIQGIFDDRLANLDLARKKELEVRELFAANLESLLGELGGLPDTVAAIGKELQALITKTSTPLQIFTAGFNELQSAIKDGLPLDNFNRGISQLLDTLVKSNIAIGEFGDAFTNALGEGADVSTLEFLDELGLSVGEFQQQLAAFSEVRPDATIDEFIQALELGQEATFEAMTAQMQLNEAMQVYRDLLQAGIIDQDAFDEAQKNLTEKFKDNTDVMNEFAIQAARNIQTAFAEFLFDPFDSSLAGLLSNFADTLKKIAAEVLANALLKQAFSFLSNLGGPIGQFAGVALGTLSQSQAGGPVSRGAPTVVGERGPEIFTPRTAGSITSNNAMESMMPTINNNVIIDPRAFTGALATPTGGRDLINAIQVNKRAVQSALQ